MTTYFLFGLIYGLIIFTIDFLNPNREHWIGILIVTILFWPIHLTATLIKYWENKND